MKPVGYYDLMMLALIGWGIALFLVGHIMGRGAEKSEQTKTP
jgi:hypothetical protein